MASSREMKEGQVIFDGEMVMSASPSLPEP
jgi:hypothetical protein